MTGALLWRSCPKTVAQRAGPPNLPFSTGSIS